MEIQNSPYPQKIISIQKLTNMDSIMFLRGNVNYTDLIFISGRKKTIARTLKCFETSSKFEKWLRIHRGFLVNPRFIKMISYQDLTLELANGQTLPIARRRSLKISQQLNY